MEKNKLTYPCLRYTIPVISSICIISALVIMYVIQTDYTQMYFESMLEKECYFLYFSVTAFWKKIVLSGLAIAVIAPYFIASQENVRSEAFIAWFRLSIVAAMSILFFVLVSPTGLYLDPSASTAIESSRLVDSAISPSTQNRFALSSPVCMLLPLSFCILFHCLGRLKDRLDIKDICAFCTGLCAICISLFSIYLLSKSIFCAFYMYNQLMNYDAIKLYYEAVLSIGAALILSCIHDALQGNRREALAIRNSKTDILFMGVCIFAVCHLSLITLTLYLFGVIPYYGHSTIKTLDILQTHMCVLLGLIVAVVSIKRRTAGYLKLLPFCLILWLSVWQRDSAAQLNFDLLSSVIKVAEEYNYIELPYIIFWCLPCVSMLLYTFYLILETPDRKTALILSALCLFAAALTYLPAYTIELPFSTPFFEKTSINSIPIVNICIELMSPVLLIVFGYRQKNIKGSSV